jgi:hypothetical protein
MYPDGVSNERLVFACRDLLEGGFDEFEVFFKGHKVVEAVVLRDESECVWCFHLVSAWVLVFPFVAGEVSAVVVIAGHSFDFFVLAFGDLLPAVERCGHLDNRDGCGA